LLSEIRFLKRLTDPLFSEKVCNKLADLFSLVAFSGIIEVTRTPFFTWYYGVLRQFLVNEGGVGVGKNIVVISILILCSLAIVWYRNTFVIIDGNLNLSVLFVDKELRGLLTDEDLVVGSAKLNNESTSEVAEIEVIFKEPNVAKELASRIVGVSYDGEIFQSTVTTGENGRAVIAVKRISEQDLQKIIQTINR